MVTKEKLQCLKLFEEGLALYRNRKFDLAIAKFNQALSFDSEDKPSKLFIERCEYFLKNPVPDDWDGVFEMKTK
jgi:hypothetical protein